MELGKLLIEVDFDVLIPIETAWVLYIRQLGA